MQSLRDWLARRFWIKLRKDGLPKPAGHPRWGADMRVLVLVNRDDEAKLSLARALNLKTLGAVEVSPAHHHAIQIIEWTSVPQKAPDKPDNLWSPAQLSFSGFIKSELLKPWLIQDYDLIVNLSPAAFRPFDHFCASARAHLRVAAHDEILEAYDLVLAGPAQREEANFKFDLERYLRILNPHHAQRAI